MKIRGILPTFIAVAKPTAFLVLTRASTITRRGCRNRRLVAILVCRRP